MSSLIRYSESNESMNHGTLIRCESRDGSLIRWKKNLLKVLITREYYPEKTLAELYDPDKMPQDLREAHAKLDDIVESCYPGYPFASDEARLECLFKLYEKMTAAKK